MTHSSKNVSRKQKRRAATNACLVTTAHGQDTTRVLSKCFTPQEEFNTLSDLFFDPMVKVCNEILDRYNREQSAKLAAEIRQDMEWSLTVTKINIDKI